MDAHRHCTPEKDRKAVRTLAPQKHPDLHHYGARLINTYLNMDTSSALLPTSAELGKGDDTSDTVSAIYSMDVYSLSEHRDLDGRHLVLGILGKKLLHDDDDDDDDDAQYNTPHVDNTDEGFIQLVTPSHVPRLLTGHQNRCLQAGSPRPCWAVENNIDTLPWPLIAILQTQLQKRYDDQKLPCFTIDLRPVVSKLQLVLAWYVPCDVPHANLQK
eukprot:5459361-Amphidinium_carterae.1